MGCNAWIPGQLVVECSVHWHEMSTLDPPGCLDGASWAKAGDTQHVPGLRHFKARDSESLS